MKPEEKKVCPEASKAREMFADYEERSQRQMGWFRSTPESEAVLAEERLMLSATEALEEAMATTGTKKHQLAELLNVAPAEISQRLSGRRNLTLRTLARMMHVLGMRVELSLTPAMPKSEGPDVGVHLTAGHNDTPAPALANVITLRIKEMPSSANGTFGHDDWSEDPWSLAAAW